MRARRPLARIAGIDLFAEPSFAVVFLLISWNLTVALDAWHPGWPLVGRAVLAIFAVAIFFASVVAHEFGHAFVARAAGIPVREVRLFLLGGVSDIEHEPTSPAVEVRLALAGPAVSFALGVAGLVLASLFAPGDAARDALASLGPLPTLFLWIGAVNLGVGVFNLLPAFPLDGGRVLRAALWAATGDRRRATRQASIVGQALGWSLVAGGVAVLFGARSALLGQGPLNGVWAALMGWFLAASARSSYRALLVEEALAGRSVRQMMRPPGWILPPTTTVADAVENWFLRSPDRSFPVVDAEGFHGLVTATDVRAVPEAARFATPIVRIMTPAARLVAVRPDDAALAALRALGRLDVEQLPVLDEGRLVGFLERRDLARYLELRPEPAPV